MTAVTSRQQHQVDRWLARSYVARLDAVVGEDGALTCNMFKLVDDRQPTMLELVGVGTVWRDGVYELHVPTLQEFLDVRPVDSDGTRWARGWAERADAPRPIEEVV